MRCVNAHVNPSFDSPMDWLSTGEHLTIMVTTATAALCPNSVMSLPRLVDIEGLEGCMAQHWVSQGAF